ncbi:MAG: RsmD family RNA methyltransferase [bacterium]
METGSAPLNRFIPLSELRPTKDIVRKALCDMLRPIIDDLVVLDLFAGSGRVGVALLEEGASSVCAVDKRPLPEGMENDYSSEEYRWRQTEVESFLSGAPSHSFDVVFMDPPYDSHYPRTVTEELLDKNLLTSQGIIAIETSYEMDLRDLTVEENSLTLMRNRTYGGSRLWLFQVSNRSD